MNTLRSIIYVLALITIVSSCAGTVYDGDMTNMDKHFQKAIDKAIHKPGAVMPTGGYDSRYSKCGRCGKYILKSTLKDPAVQRYHSVCDRPGEYSQCWRCKELIHKSMLNDLATKRKHTICDWRD